MNKKAILRMHPLPWEHRTEQLSEGYSTIIYDANGHRPILDHLREDEALDIITAVNAHEASIKTLEACAKRFREYEQSHLAKDTHDGRMKADRNADMAEMCETTLKLARGEQ